MLFSFMPPLKNPHALLAAPACPEDRAQNVPVLVAFDHGVQAVLDAPFAVVDPVGGVARDIVFSVHRPPRDRLRTARRPRSSPSPPGTRDCKYSDTGAEARSPDPRFSGFRCMPPSAGTSNP